MIGDDLSKSLEQLEIRAEKFRKKIAYISGAKATTLAQELEKIENEISNIKSSLKKEDVNKLHSKDGRIGSVINNLDTAEKNARQYFTVWILIFLLLILTLLGSLIVYLRGYLYCPMETAPIDCNDVNVIIYYPYALKLDKYDIIHCVATRKKSDYQGKVLIEFIRDNRFSFKDNVNHYIFDFTDPLSPSSYAWTTEIKYNQLYSWMEHLSFLIHRKHLDIGLKSRTGDFVSRECICFLIISFYSQLLNISLVIISLIGIVMTSFLRLGNFFKTFIKILFHYAKNHMQ